MMEQSVLRIRCQEGLFKGVAHTSWAPGAGGSWPIETIRNGGFTVSRFHLQQPEKNKDIQVGFGKDFPQGVCLEM